MAEAVPAAVATLTPLTEDVVHWEGDDGRLFFLLIEADMTSVPPAVDDRLDTAGEFIRDEGIGVAGSEWLLPCSRCISKYTDSMGINRAGHLK